MDQTLIDVSSTFIENIFRSGLTLLSCNDIIIIIKVDKKIVKNHKKINKQKRLFKKNGCQMDKRETNSDHEMEKR